MLAILNVPFDNFFQQITSYEIKFHEIMLIKKLYIF